MPRERYAKWDTMKLPYGFNEAYIEPPKTVEGERARRRVAPFEEYLALAEEDANSEHAQLALRSLSREARRRWSHWRTPSAMGEVGFVLTVVSFGARGLGIVGLLVVTLYLFTTSRAVWLGSGSGLLVLGIVMAIVAVLIYALVRWRRGRRTPAEKLKESICMDCGYSLAETKPAIAAKDLDGLWVGPRACPECGAPWPMLPPPVFEG